MVECLRRWGRSQQFHRRSIPFLLNIPWRISLQTPSFPRWRTPPPSARIISQACFLWNWRSWHHYPRACCDWRISQLPGAFLAVSYWWWRRALRPWRRSESTEIDVWHIDGEISEACSAVSCFFVEFVEVGTKKPIVFNVVHAKDIMLAQLLTIQIYFCHN